VLVGEFLPFDLRRLAKKLNALQSFARAEVILPIEPSPPDVANDDLSYFCVAPNLIADMQSALAARGIVLSSEDSVVGFTSARISLNAADPKGEYFSYFKNEFVPEDVDERYAIVSTALWQQKYERVAYRNGRQYAVWAVLGYWLDRFVKGGLTHAEFRYCIGDAIGELDSIVFSLKKARLCSSCNTKLNKSGREDLIEASKEMLGYVRRPPLDRVLQSMQQSPIPSFMVMGVLFSVFMGSVGEAVGRSNEATGISAALFVVIFLVFMIKEHWSPGDRLG
jgi:hypothetical protein